MKNFRKNIFTYILSALFILTSVLSTLAILGMQGIKTCTPLSFAEISQDETTEGEETNESIFLMDLKLIYTYGTNIYVYDEFDQTIKIIDSQTKKFKQDHASYKFEALKDLIVFEDVLMMFSSENHQFSCILANDFSKSVSFDQSGLTTIETAKTIELITIDEQSYILLCPENPTSSYFEIAKISKIEESESTTIELTDIKTFSVQSGFASLIPTYEDIYITEYESNIHIMVVTSANIFSFIVNPSDIKSEYTNIISVTGFSVDANDKILDISNITFSDETSLIAITKQSKIEFFNIEVSVENGGTEVTITLTQDVDKTVEITEFVPTGASGHSSLIALFSTEDKNIKIYNFAEQNQENLEIEIENPIITEKLFENVADFKYVKVKQGVSANIYSLPYDTEALCVATQNTNIVVLGQGVDQFNSPIYGWDFVMLSSLDNTRNYYGYIKSENIQELETKEYNREYATVQAYSKLYSLPSTYSDLKNSVIMDIPSNSRLEILSGLNDYSSLGNKYLLVKVNGDKIGFINRARLVNITDLNEKIIPNATVMRDNSEIFTDTSEARQTILTLNKGTRVKVIGKRDTITNFTKITFSDEEGNQYTGYIYTYNLEPDSWTMMQIIGTILILVNIILLVIIICLKNKLTR